MAQPYSLNLRERVAPAVNRGDMSRQEAARHFGVAASTAIIWVKRLGDTGSLAPGKIGGHRPKKIVGVHRDWLLQRCQERQFTLRGLMAELAERGLIVGYRAVWNFIHAEKLSYKKTVLAAEQEVASVMCGCVDAPCGSRWMSCDWWSGRVRSCVRPLMRPDWPRALMSFAVRVPDQCGALDGALTDTVSLATDLPISLSSLLCTSPPADSGRRSVAAGPLCGR